MKCLILDTSKDLAQMGLSDGNLLVAHLSLAVKEFPAAIPSLFDRAKIDKKELNFIAVGIGPGSYTGTRSGVTYAKALSFALNIPLIPFYSQLLYLEEGEGDFTLFYEGKREDALVIQGNISKKEIRSFSEPRMCSISDLPLLLEEKILESPKPHFLPLLLLLQKIFYEQTYPRSSDVKPVYIYEIEKYAPVV